MKTAFYLIFMFVCVPLSAQQALDISKLEKSRVVRNAEKYLNEKPVTVTAFSSPRSAGGLHDYFSESDYWWPDSTNPAGPYVRYDGMTNPANFVAHRHALIDLSLRVAALTAAYKITLKKKYAKTAINHLVAWFVADATKMSPHLSFAQAVKGRSTGRGVGIIDTIHLIEVVRSAEILEKAGMLSKQEADKIREWFREYLHWMQTHKNGVEERDAKNNHGTCWAMQAAAYAKYVGDTATVNMLIKRFKEVLLPNQLAKDGSFPLELERTKPYSYSLFTLDAMVTTAQILSNEKENLFLFSLPDGRSLKTAMEFMYPFIADKSKWKFPPDVMYYDDFPVRQVALLFCGVAYKEDKYISLWKTLNPDPTVQEVIRNFPIRQPILWVN